MARKSEYKHATREDEQGWYSYPPKPRNLLNKTGHKRPGTLGYRTTRGLGKAYNPREGKVNPPAPVKTKRAQLMLGSQDVETWATKASVHTEQRTATTYSFRGTSYATWDEWNAAVEASAS